MKETLFYQVRQENTVPLAELALLIRHAFISLYPGTSFDEDMSTLYGTGHSFFLSRARRTESIMVFVVPELLDLDALADIKRKAAEAEDRVREFRSGTQAFLVSVVVSSISEAVKKNILMSSPGWSLFEYLLLQSETDEGLALKPLVTAPPHVPVIRSTKNPDSNPAVSIQAPTPQVLREHSALPDRRLSPEELSALIDLSLGLEMRARGIDWDGPPARKPDIDA